MTSATQPPSPDFEHLKPDLVLDAVESALGLRCTNLCRPLNSYINRVYEVELDDPPPDQDASSAFVIAKFYRPGRWSDDALQDELDFLHELHEAEIPVVPPLHGRDGTLLHVAAGARFAVFPKKGGRPLEGPGDDAWEQIGRLIARLHTVGQAHAPRDRIRLHPQHSTLQHLQFILESDTIPAPLHAAYEDAVRSLIDDIAPLFEEVESFRIHADLHGGNILHRPDEGFHVLDFDDMAVGPAVQDLWMILPDRLAATRIEVELLLEGYETFLAFPRSSLRLIEPLRAMRFIHYTAWCARQKSDGGFARLAPDWGSHTFWRQEIADLAAQRLEIDQALRDFSAGPAPLSYA